VSFPKLCGSLVNLRELTNEDVNDITHLMSSKISSFLWDVPPYRTESAQRFIHSSLIDFKSFKAVHFAIDYKNKSDSHNLLVGCISLIGINQARKRASIGATWIGEEYWGKGIATECIQLLLKYAFSELRLKEVNSYVFPENKASIRMLENNGMKRIRRFNKYYQIEDRYRHLDEYLVYSNNCRYPYCRYSKRIIVGFIRRFLIGCRMNIPYFLTRNTK
jgi:[ribosomal protein S5]-alanine N-acetyltransferase